MGLADILDSERRDLARRYLDGAEAWLRRLIESKLVADFGPAYLEPGEAGSCLLIAKHIRQEIDHRYESERDRFPRRIDAADLGHAITIVLNPELYSAHFKDALHEAFPDGAAEARTFLNRLHVIRNKLAHVGACSARDVERAVCYSNDLADSIKKHFRALNMEREFNVPRFIRVVDNKGNEFHLNPEPNAMHQFIDVRTRGQGDLYVGDELTIEVEVDPNFDGYTVDWLTFNGDTGNGAVRLRIDLKHVGVQMDVRFHVRSKEQWHRLHGGADDMLDLRYRVLPPSN